jgi:hypothetical protein
MRLNKMTWSLLAGAMTLSVLSVAAARTGSVLASTTAKLLGMPNGALFGAVEVKSEREVELPPEQQLAMSRQFLTRMEQNTTTVRAQLEHARAARDVVKALCLNDKLNQIEIAVRSAKDRAATHQSAIEGKDKDRARHEFMILQVIRDRVEQLVKEANQCIGEEAGFIGESEVSLQVSENIPDNNPDHLGDDPDIISEPPVLSSPTQ